MLRLKNLSNKYQKRTCRPVYANTQATPYAATLHSSFRNSTTGAIQALGASATDPVSRLSVAAYQSNNSYLPGMVVTKVKNSEDVTIAAGITTERPFGLLANFVGGDFDEGFNGDRLQNEVGVWRGLDAVFEVLAPAFHPDVEFSNDGSTDATNLYAGKDGRLCTDGCSTYNSGSAVVGRLLKKETNRILVDLAV